MHKDLFLIVVADQDGDASWNMTRDWKAAVAFAVDMQETAYEKPKIFQIDGDTLTHKEREWNRLDRKEQVDGETQAR